ncbi:hypothetical protein [Perlabentimonas gracilis]|uniref:hypothetical protein n=1 Tax=Perlabentimonas gracilis TaxID=2715279 RepID=UPI00140874AE|nr:hypothetical protein [Perlabentimonas gracilis]NHB67872.1 hypothetical protein [Perlabentimonas gracilis]
MNNLGVQEMVETDGGGGSWLQLLKELAKLIGLSEAYDHIKVLASAAWEHQMSGYGYNGSLSGFGLR